MTVWLVILAVAAGSYGLRATMLVAVDPQRLPRWVDHAFTFVAPAMAGALVAMMAFTREGGVDPAPVPEIAAMVAGFLAVRRSGKIIHALVAGMPTLWALRILVG
jgi:branched-subunit amino acid transport protein